MESISQFLSNLLTGGSGTIALNETLLAIGIAYIGGILSSLTPCVYPMIPITISVIGGLPHRHGAGATGPARSSWSEVISRGFAYVIGMALVYSFLGVAAGLSGRVFGSFTNTSGWYLGLGIIMTIAS